MSEQPSRGRSVLAILLAGLASLGAFAAFLLIAIPMQPVVFAAVIVIGVFGMIGVMHYVVWGWWLMPVLRGEVEEEERAVEEARERDRFA